MEYSVYSSVKYGYILVPEHLETGYFTATKGPMTKVLSPPTSMNKIKNVALLKRKSTSLIPMLILVGNKDKKLSITEYIRRNLADWEISLEKANHFKKQLLNQPNSNNNDSETKQVVSDVLEKHPESLKQDNRVKENNDDIQENTLSQLSLLDSVNSKPLPANVIVDSTSAEKPYLSTHINYYLKDLGLHPFNQNVLVDLDKIFRFSTKGDSLAKLLVLEKTDDYDFSSKLLQNENMAYAMMRLGYREFTNTTTHLAGTFFETLLQVAHKQGNKKVLDLLLDALVGRVSQWEEESNELLFDLEGENTPISRGSKEENKTAESPKERPLDVIEKTTEISFKEISPPSKIVVHESDNGFTFEFQDASREKISNECLSKSDECIEQDRVVFEKELTNSELKYAQGLEDIEKEDFKLNPNRENHSFVVSYILVEKLLNILRGLGVTKGEITDYVGIGIPASKFTKLSSASINVHAKLIRLGLLALAAGDDEEPLKTLRNIANKRKEETVNA